MKHVKCGTCERLFFYRLSKYRTMGSKGRVGSRSATYAGALATYVSETTNPVTSATHDWPGPSVHAFEELITTLLYVLYRCSFLTRVSTAVITQVSWLFRFLLLHTRVPDISPDTRVPPTAESRDSKDCRYHWILTLLQCDVVSIGHERPGDAGCLQMVSARMWSAASYDWSVLNCGAHSLTSDSRPETAMLFKTELPA
jgi:hypothetical protein